MKNGFRAAATVATFARTWSFRPAVFVATFARTWCFRVAVHALASVATVGMVAVGMIAVFLTAASGGVSPAVAESPSGPFEFRENERIVLLGDAFIERWQGEEFLETALTLRFPEKNLVFRNLGWSGDTVWGEARAVFGQADDGFQRLLKDVRECRPTLIAVAYGANEANAGKGELARFRAGLMRLLDELAKSNAATAPRLVLVSPRERENLGPPLPDQAGYNAVVRLYAEAMAALAQERGLPYFDLLSLRGPQGPEARATPQSLDPWTENGLHLSPYGQWRAAPEILARMGAPWPRVEFRVDAAAGTCEASGGKFELVRAGATGVELKITEACLSYPPLPPHLVPANRAGQVAARAEAAPPALLRVTNLPAGKYDLQIDEQAAGAYLPEQLAAGVSLAEGPALLEVSRLRELIRQKNELYFHRYRPQNETYLFLFRKHEQGNNAVEIPQFDPLVEAKEAEIAKLKAPRPRTLRLTKSP